MHYRVPCCQSFYILITFEPIKRMAKLCCFSHQLYFPQKLKAQPQREGLAASKPNLQMTQWHMFSDNQIHQLQSNQTCFSHLNAESDSNHCACHQSAQYNMVVRSVVFEQSLLWLGSQSTDCKLEIWYWNMDITFSFSLLPPPPPLHPNMHLTVLTCQFFFVSFGRLENLVLCAPTVRPAYLTNPPTMENICWQLMSTNVIIWNNSYLAN